MAALNPSLAGALTGAVLGAIGRAVVVGVHLREINEAALGLLSAALIGVIIGALAGLTGKPLLGAVTGAVLSAALAYLALYPVVLLFHALGTLTAASIWEVVAVAALSGGLGGAAGRMAAPHQSRRTP